MPAKAPSAWIVHVKKVYAEMKKKNSSAKYSDALKEAKKSYKGKM